ncbi:MAG: hypothetical protein O3A84_06890 [Proteobacteria bacterium]|nr:hypothetical protein [Pseudomonadota bacterium]
MADTNNDENTVWTLVAASPEDIGLGADVEHYRLDGMECRYFRSGEVGGIDHRPDRVNIHTDPAKRITKIRIG